MKELPPLVEKHQVGTKKFLQVFCNWNATNEVFNIYHISSSAPRRKKRLPITYESISCNTNELMRGTVFAGYIEFSEEKGEIIIKTSSKLRGSGDIGINEEWLLKKSIARLRAAYEYEDYGNKSSKVYPCHR